MDVVSTDIKWIHKGIGLKFDYKISAIFVV